MIGVFRKIRQKLLSESKFSTYLVYAIGEIVLIVFGILIALFINSIYTKNVHKNLEVNYLQAIIENINEDIEDLQNRIKKDSVHLNSYTRLMQAVASDSVLFSNSELTYIIHNSSIINYFNPQNTVFEEMKSSGNLSLVKSNLLRYDIMEYYNQSKKVVASQEINNQFIMEHKGKSIDKFLDMNSIIENNLPQQWSIELTPLDHSFFEKDKWDPEVEQFGTSMSLMKAVVLINHNWKVGLLAHAKKTKLKIEEYLSTK